MRNKLMKYSNNAHSAIRPFVHATDIYACEPGILTAHFRPMPKAGDCFFFATFKRQPGNSGRGVRAAGPGHWHTQGHTTDVLDNAGVKVGKAKKFCYKKARTSMDWLMDEFSSCSKVPHVETSKNRHSNTLHSRPYTRKKMNSGFSCDERRAEPLAPVSWLIFSLLGSIANTITLGFIASAAQAPVNSPCARTQLLTTRPSPIVSHPLLRETRPLPPRS
jgi:hypothetical protein